MQKDKKIRQYKENVILNFISDDVMSTTIDDVEYRVHLNHPFFAVAMDGTIRSTITWNKLAPFSRDVNNSYRTKDGKRLKNKKLYKVAQCSYWPRHNGYNITALHHRLIALNWIPNPNNLRDVHHINGDGLDNRIENLEWSSHRDNTRVISEEKVWKILHMMWFDRKSPLEISKKVGCRPVDTLNIREGKCWKDIKLKFELEHKCNIGEMRYCRNRRKWFLTVEEYEKRLTKKKDL